MTETFATKFCETLICAYRLRKEAGNGIEVCQGVVTIIRNTPETIFSIGDIIREGSSNETNLNAIETIEQVESSLNGYQSEGNQSFLNKVKSFFAVKWGLGRDIGGDGSGPSNG